MEKDLKIEELTKRVSELEHENKKLQNMLQKVIKKYKKLKDVPHNPPALVSPDVIPPKVSEFPPPLEFEVQAVSNISDHLLMNLEIDNLSFVQASIPSITLNYYFETLGTFLIHEAVKAGSIKVLNYLCAKGVDMNAKSKSGESPLTLGAEENKHDAMCIILQQGREKINLEYANAAGMTALQIAVKNGNKEIVSLLIAHGANVLATNFFGDSLIKIAQRNGHQEIVLLLVNAGGSLR